MKKLLLILLFLLIIPVVHAEYHLKLLAVSLDDNQIESGSVADLFLETKEGKGRVFLETYPVTKFDTQISTRFAKEIACDFSDIDCTDTDFIYTIKAQSSIIGGPSAGAAISVLTTAALNNLKVDENVAITGSINSGGIIGPVGGIKQKIEAAAQNDIKKVLIPKGKGTLTRKTNESIDCTIIDNNIVCKKINITEINSTLDLIEYGNSLGLEIIEVSTLDEAVFHFTGKVLRENDKQIVINQDYTNVMKYLSEILCNRTDNIASSISIEDLNNNTITINELAVNLTEKAKTAFDNEEYYSTASYCFGANVKFGEVLLHQLNVSDEKALKQVIDLKDQVRDFNEIIENQEIKTITDLETFMVVKERLIEAQDLLVESQKNIENHESYIGNFALAVERIHSADAWSKFFGFEGKEFILNKEDLEQSCRAKISEAEERFQYISLFTVLLEDSRKELDRAYIDLNNKDYELCLFKASKAKAEVDSILNVIGVEEEDLSELIDDKLKIIEREIADQISEGAFPILSYSYFEYANSLKNTDPYSALLYSEYALELSDLDIYFKEKEPIFTIKSIDYSKVAIVISSTIIGFIIGYIWFYRKSDNMVIRIK